MWDRNERTNFLTPDMLRREQERRLREWLTSQNKKAGGKK